jgi:hypothetical protein
MAKRKDAVALFEVITATKKKEAAAAAAARASAGGVAPKPAPPVALRTPKWWFKGKKSGAESSSSNAAPSYSTPALPPPVENDPTHFADVAPYDPTTAAPAPGVVQRVVPAGYTAPPERVTIPTASAASERVGLAVDPFGLDHPAPTGPAYPGKPRRSFFNIGGAKKVNLDPDRREVTVRFRYTTAIIVGFALCVAVGLAYVTGRQTNKAKAGAAGVSSDQVKRGPILAGVLDVAPADRTLSTNATDVDAKESDTPHAQPPKDRPKTATPTPPATPTGTQPKGAIDPKLPGEANGVETRLPRSVGLNYVVVQSYLDPTIAQDAKKALEEAGIPCTVERGLQQFAQPNFYCVVGTHGFTAVRTSPAYRQYEAAVLAVNKSFAGNSKVKKFEPTPYKWRAQ